MKESTTPNTYQSPNQLLQEIIDNQAKAAKALVAELEARSLSYFIEVHDAASGRRISVAVDDIQRVVETATLKASIIGTTTNFATIESYEDVRKLLK